MLFATWLVFAERSSTAEEFRKARAEGLDRRWGSGSVVDSWRLDRQRTREAWIKPLEPNVPTDDPDAPTLVRNPHPHP